MSFRSLEIFCAVADQRSFSKAAAVLDLTQSAVSQSVQHLEDVLEVRLIDRGQRPLALTPAGQIYHRGVRELLRDYQQLLCELRRGDRPLAGELRVGTIYSVGLSYMPDAIAEFTRQHPDAEVKLEFGGSGQVVEWVKNGEVDLGLVSFPRNSKQIGHIVWQHEPMRLVCSVRHPLASRTEIGAKDLHELPMIGFDRQLVLRQEIDRRLSEVGIRPDFNIEFDNADSMVRAIEAHGGIGILPEAVVRRETASGSLRVVACPAFEMRRPLGFIFRRTAKLSDASIEFASMLLGRRLPIDHRGRLVTGEKHSPDAAIPSNRPNSSPTTSVVA